MHDLYSEQEAKQLIEGLIPDPLIRRICLNMFVEAIHEANGYGRDKWHVEPACDGHVWLVTGSLVTCSLGESHIWFSLDQQLAASQAAEPLVCDGTATNWSWQLCNCGYVAEAEGTDSSASACVRNPLNLNEPAWDVSTVINGFYTPGENHARIWPHLRRLLKESIYRTILTPLDTGLERFHSPGILFYLRNELERHVPDPLW
jgi:hypothetical protein